MTGHNSTITSIIPCDKTKTIIASSSLDQTIRIWDIKRRLEVNCIPTDTFVPLSISWNESDPTNIFAGGKGLVKMFNINTRKGTSHKLGTESDIVHISHNPKHPEQILCITSDNTLIIYNYQKKSVLFRMKSSSEKVTDYSWDPLSEYYLLCTFEDGKVILFDTSSPQNFILKTYTPDCRSISTIAWLPTEPGNFITGDKYSGIIRVWNVAQSEPSKRIKVRKSGIRFFSVLGSDDEEEQKKDDQLAIAFDDGSVGIYNRKQREMEFITLPGHSETIFDCSFSSYDSNLFATSSFDGSIKIWNIKKQECEETLIGEENVITYSISWHPFSSKIAGALGNGNVWIWDAQNGRVLQKHKHHQSLCYKVAWNQQDPTLIASSSKDKTVCVFREDGKILKQFKHPNGVFGIDWSPHDRNLLATGCFDGIVRIFDVSKSTSEPILKLIGHTDKVYNVVWHPIISNLLMSGSNDYTIRVWNTTDGTFKELKGHKNNIRALSWNPEIPEIAISGSWDGFIRVWDVQSGKTISFASHHHVDVYGLSVHPKRPFIYGSTSRDSTIRFWTLEPIFKNIVLKSILSKSLAPVISKPESPFITTRIESALCGAASLELQESIKTCKTDVDIYEKLFDYFSFPQGTNDLWTLAKVVVEGDVGKPTSEFTHSKSVSSHLDSTAKELENSRNQKYGGGLGSSSKEDLLKEAAKIYLSIGNLFKYCEIMSEIGEWKIALAVAPSVSQKYWKQLVSKYIQHLQEEDQSADLVPYLTAIGNADELISYYSKRKNFKQASISAIRQAENIFPEISEDGPLYVEKKPNVLKGPSRQMLRVASQRAEHHLKLAQPISAACTYLSIDEYQQAVRALMKGDEVLMAYALSKVCNILEMDDIHVSIASLCEKFQMWDVGIEMLQLIQDRNAVSRFMCSIREKTDLPENEMEKLFLRSGFQAPSFYATEAKTYEKSNPYLSIRFYALAQQHQEAATLANQQFDQLFGESSWNWKEIEECMNSSQCINATKITNEVKIRFMAYMNYIGLQRALWKGYYIIAPCLIMNARNACKQLNSFPIPWETLDYKLCIAYSKNSRVECNSLISQVLESKISNETAEDLKRLRNQIQSNAAFNSFKNIVIPTGSTLPTRSIEGTRIQSYISKALIGAPFITLEDNKSYVSLAEAIMWGEVNTFSPTMSGYKLHY